MNISLEECLWRLCHCNWNECAKIFYGFGNLLKVPQATNSRLPCLFGIPLKYNYFLLQVMTLKNRFETQVSNILSNSINTQLSVSSSLQSSDLIWICLCFAGECYHVGYFQLFSWIGHTFNIYGVAHIISLPGKHRQLTYPEQADRKVEAKRHLLQFSCLFFWEVTKI